VQLENSFTVPATPEVAWGVLLDVERVAPCMPGATLTSHEGDNFAGTVKVKVGPISMTYKGTAAFVDRDDAARTVKIDAKGKETRGAGTANATITCTLTPEGEGTRVDVLTDLAITGKPAQFGRGVIGEVAAKVITQFSESLAEEIRSGGGEAAAPAAAPVVVPDQPDADSAPDAAPEAVPDAVAAPAAEAAQPTPPAAPAQPAQPRRSAEAIDLLDVAGAPVAKRLIPVGVAALVALLIVLLVRRRRR
jgi:carbon monoxide dehydrogenase subunit G